MAEYYKIVSSEKELENFHQYGNPVTVLNWADYEGEPSNV